MEIVKLGDVLKYEQPTKYIVHSTQYNNDFDTPVLTAGKSFLLGYTDEEDGVFKDIPVIIFDDFTTAIKFVDFPFKVKSSAMKILKPNRDIADIRFLFYRLMKIKTNSSQHKRYWISKYSQLEIPLPPLPEQKRIAAILDEADKILRLNKKLIKKYEVLTQSLFLDMFGDPVTNPKRWETKTIEEITKKDKGSIKRGPFGGALKKEIFVEDGYLVYEQYHALNNDFSFARYFIDENKFNELKGFEVKPNDIIISCSGVYLGKLAIVPEGAREGIINQALLKITLDEKKMRNDFFVFHFTQKNFKETYFDANRGAGIPNFPPMAIFKKFPFVVPPIDLQNEFTRRIEAIEKQKAHAQESLKKSDDLFNALLQKAFKGELIN
jgi:restriction endonuclease S subunit